ncbi:E3 ubiquitin ligase, putative [Ixodes scapularis]|uniref:RBR-type E3 ubiquitin transferase n=1 Tax=Ixodes scapularis TaxID=6945 RepID=B7P5A1_IXOSC|nr:E3 ubiquitin ligase, putative [Ixodes scapularis]|eukprot:XP_002407182.1 E3 ubiquitin ligase, putative [Ixodes scapularis]
MSEPGSDLELSTDSDAGYEDYYNYPEDGEIDQQDQRKLDPEYFEFECLTIEDVERLLNESVEVICASLSVMPSLAKVLLHTHNWNAQEMIQKYKQNAAQALADARIKPLRPPAIDMQTIRNSPSVQCPICLQNSPGDRFRGLACGHYFCPDCWAMHFEIQILQGISTAIECMGQYCNILVPEDFVLSMLNKSSLREKYQQFMFSDYVRSHPELRFCPGLNCNIIIQAKEQKSKRVICKHCKTTFCFRCGTDYHAPADCETIKKWITKCADDSETANYISAHTKDWENHAKSLRLEEMTLRKIKNRINEKVMANQGTWIDWQYLLDAVALLAKCRYSLQYTYPYAYFMDPGPRKELFEYQQATLEAEIENLSWKVERAETTDRGDLENQMDIAEKRRSILLKDFLVV